MNNSPASDSIYDIVSNQNLHDLTSCQTLNRKYRHTVFSKPISQRSLDAFRPCLDLIRSTDAPIHLDSGCGKGTSSLKLAQHYPDHWIIAVDQSQHRLSALPPNLPSNLIVLCMDCIDLWRLLNQHDIPIAKHTLFYPNPWPKKKHEKRRWHTHPIAPVFFHLGQQTILRSNWLFYLESCQVSAHLYGLHTHLSQIQPTTNGISHFETKYIHCHVRIYQLTITNMLMGAHSF